MSGRSKKRQHADLCNIPAKLTLRQGWPINHLSPAHSSLANNRRGGSWPAAWPRSWRAQNLAPTTLPSVACARNRPREIRRTALSPSNRHLCDYRYTTSSARFSAIPDQTALTLRCKLCRRHRRGSPISQSILGCGSCTKSLSYAARTINVLGCDQG
jgi:hypothetical protein